LSRGGLACAAGLFLAALLGCTVDQIVGITQSETDAGPQVCADTCTCPAGQSCDFLCGAQSCTSGCTNMSDCARSCDGGTCHFACEGHQPCSPGCTPGPCQIACNIGNENVDCTVTCTPAEDCAVDCSGGSCTVVCGSLRPATDCDGGVYTCAGTCP